MRDKKIDLLRFIGLSLMILAHIDPPGWIFQLRNFDVPLIVMASGMAFLQANSSEHYGAYVCKRFKRLAFPVWIFLTIYFLALKITGFLPERLTAPNIWNNYTFTNASGFFWIIRVFILVALAAPFAACVGQKIKSNKTYLIGLLAAFLVYEGFQCFVTQFPEDIWWSGFLNFFVCYAIAYTLIFSFGMRLSRLTAKELFFVGAFAFGVFLIFGALYHTQEGRFVSTQHYKYPPSTYYVSYAIAASILVWSQAKRIVGWIGRVALIECVVMFIAQNSLWIYMWHTIFLLVAYRMHSQNFAVKYVTVYALASVTVFLQVTAVKEWILPLVGRDRVKKELKSLLTG